MSELIADGANHDARDPAHHVRLVTSLADLPEDGRLLFLRDAGFKDDNHSFCVIGPKVSTKKPQVWRPAAELMMPGRLTQPQPPLRRPGKVIPTGKVSKWLTARIHWAIYSKMDQKVKPLSEPDRSAA